MNPRFLLPLLLISATAHAATFAVHPNTSIQAKIDAAKAGDIVAIFGGAYYENITINKAVRLVEVTGQEVFIAGVTFSGVITPPPFEGFAIGIGGAGIVVSNTPGLVFRNIDAKSSGSISINGNSSLAVVDSQLSTLNASGGTVSISNSSLTGSIYAGGDSLKITNSTVAGNIDQSAGTFSASTATIGGYLNNYENAQTGVISHTTIGNVTWLSNTSLTISDSQLSDLQANNGSVDISSSGLGSIISVVSSMKILNSSLRGNLTAGGSSLKITKSTLAGAIIQTAGTLHASSVTVGGNFDAYENSQKTVGFRTTVAGDMTWRSKKAWFGYSKARSFYFAGNGAKVALVGTEIDRVNQEAYGMKLHGSDNQYLVTNCDIHNIVWHGAWSEEIGIWVAGGGNSAVLQNNSIRMQWSNDSGYRWGYNYYWQYVQYYYNENGSNDSDAIRVQDTTAVTIRNNIFYGCMYEINAPFGVQAANNLQCFNSQSNHDGFEVRGGVIPINSVTADPLFVENEAPKLQAGSPCINAGTPDPLYNDRDGSQNDIGPAGGAWFDPEGWTTDKPVVISFDLSPEQVLEGADTEVVISNGGAVSQP